MRSVQKVFCLALALAVGFVLAGCDVAVPIATLEPTLPGASPTARPTIIPAVAETATALAVAVASGITPPTPTPSASPEPATATALPSETATALPTETWESPTPGATRTAIADPTQGDLPPGCSALHTVLPGEWLGQIAELYNVGVDQLASANQIADPSTLSAGQVLCIPGSRPQPAVSGTPTPTPSPTVPPASGLAILSFSASPNPVERGTVVRLGWTLQAASAVTLTAMTYDDKLNVWYRQSAPTYTGTGDAELTVAVAVDARQPLRYELQAADVNGAVVSAQTDLLQLVCYPLFFTSTTDPTYCMHAPRSAPAEFQAFERGYMIWNSDSRDIYILLQDPGSYGFWLLWSPAGKTVEIGLPQGGFFGPGAHFAEAWGTLGPAELGGSLRLRDILGWATALPQTFTLTEQVKLDARYAMFDAVYLGWPDGRAAQLYTGGGAPRPGGFGPAWQLFIPVP